MRWCISLLILMLPGFSFAGGGFNFYIWQRELPSGFADDPAVRRFFVLAAEFDRDGLAFAPERSYPGRRVTPVVRIHAEAFSSPGIADGLAALAVKWRTPALQIDCDVPESKLGEFGKLLSTLRSKLGNIELSATVLPCHLKYGEVFSSAVAPLDFYVLQLHGIERPERIDTPYRLIDINTARTATARAVKLGKPFMIALPTYGYRLYFNKSDGRFAAISAEGAPPPKGLYDERLAVPDKEVIAALRRENPGLETVYFRYPVSGDELNFDMETVKALDSGIAPADEFNISVRTVKNGIYELVVGSRAAIRSSPLRVVISWHSLRGEAVLFDGAREIPELSVCGILPRELAVMPPPCGRSRIVARFITGEPPDKVEILP